MKYELWTNKDKSILSFLGVDNPNYEQSLQIFRADEEIELVWTTEAKTYNEAMQKYHDFMDWGEYKPIDE